MSKLIFEIKGDERKWDLILKDFIDEDLRTESKIEYVANASSHMARVHFLNYKHNHELVEKLSKSDQIISAYMIDNKNIVRTIR